jgi:hypothetical protein
VQAQIAETKVIPETQPTATPVKKAPKHAASQSPASASGSPNIIPGTPMLRLKLKRLPIRLIGHPLVRQSPPVSNVLYIFLYYYYSS